MIGLDISNNSVKVVWLTRHRNVAYKAHAAERFPDTAMSGGMVKQKRVVQDVIKKALAGCNIPKKMHDAVVVSIPEKQSFLRVLEIPDMTDDEITEAVQWEVAQHIPYGIESVYLDWQPLQVSSHLPKSGRIEVQVGASKRDVIDGVYEALLPLQLDIAAFELEAQALARCLISKELKERQGLLIVDLGRSATNVIIHDHGALRFTATLPRGVSHISDRAPERVSAIARKELSTLSDSEATSLARELMPLMEELGAQIHGIAEFYNSIDAQHEVREIILTGGGANMPGLDTALMRFFSKVHVQRGNPWVNIVSGQREVKPPIGIKESARYCVALGLALRPVIV